MTQSAVPKFYPYLTALVPRLQEDLNLINSWSSHSGLTFNISKSCLLRFYNRSTSTIDATYQSDIPSLDRCKDLGIIFCSDLSWSHHYNHILAKAYRQLGLIRRTFSSVSVRAKKLLYISMVRSQLTYCSLIWRPHLIKQRRLANRENAEVGNKVHS